MFDEIMQEIEDNFDLKYDICGAYLDNKCEISDDFFEMASDREIGFYIIKLKKLSPIRSGYPHHATKVSIMARFGVL